MARSTWTQNNFNGGEWSPLAYGRSDLAKYKNALSTCLNYVPTAQGGLTRRPGSRYVAEVKSSADAVRLVRFEFSITQAYIIEFGPSYVRFYTNGGQLLTDSTAAYNGATAYNIGDLVKQGGVVYYCIAATTGNAPPNATYWYAQTTTALPGFDSIYEIPTTYAAADLQALSFTQSADVLYIAHPSYAPRKLIRTGEAAWTLNTISFTDGPYLLVNSTATTMDWSAMTGSVTVSLSSTVGVNGGAGFLATDVGRVIRYKPSTEWGWGTITGVTDTLTATLTVSASPSGAHSHTTLWRMGVWGGTAGYPSCVTFNQDRLIWAGSTGYPSRLDGSNTSDYENMSPSGIDGVVVDSNALAFTLNSNSVSAINWMLSDEWGLLIGTATGEWVMAASSTQTAVTPTNVTAKQTTSYGTCAVPPVRMGKSTLYVQRTKRKLREMTYQFTLGTFSAPDISLVSEHLTKGGIKQMAAQLAPYPNLWMVRLDGTLVGMSYDKDQEIFGWHRHELGGYSDAAQTLPPVVESVATIPAPSVDRDEVWIVVQRYVNGGVKRYVEVLSKFWEDGDAVADGAFVDSSATYSGASTTTVSGLTWLAGQTVSVLADGSVHPPVTVSVGGVATLVRSVTKAQIGLGYTSLGKTMRIESGGADGQAQGKLKRIHRAIMRLFQTVGLNLISNTGSSTPEPFRTSADLMDNPIALYTGDKRWAFDGSYEVEGQVAWSQSDPLPSNILMVVAQLDTQDGG